MYAKQSEAAETIHRLGLRVRNALQPILADSLEANPSDPEGDALTEQLGAALDATLALHTQIEIDHLWLPGERAQALKNHTGQLAVVLRDRVGNIRDAMVEQPDRTARIDLQKIRPTDQQQKRIRELAELITMECRAIIAPSGE